jgi:alkylation response protein AidB-like acyl-CoA dehydrogenase
MNFNLTDDQKQLQEIARSFAVKEMAPQAARWDQEKVFPVEVLRQLGQLGFMAIYTQPEHGGSGLTRSDGAIVFEELAAACTSTAAYVTIHNMVTWMVDRFGSPELRSAYVPRLASAESLGSYCLSEPWSGSDAAALRTTAKKKGNSYILNGTKAWVSGGGATDVLIVMARTGEAGPKGISSFVVETSSKGISYGENEKKMGWNSQPTRIINLDEVEVPARNLLGEEGMGFKIAMQGLDGGRINIATCSVGAAQASLSYAQKYSLERKQFGRAIGEFQGMQWRMAELATELVAARQMVRLAAFKLDTKDPEATAYCAMAKLFATDRGFEICNQALQFLGGYGYTKEYPMERYLRDTRVHQILEGTNEVMRIIIARRFMEENGPERIR